MFGGVQGNANNFPDYASCREACVGKTKPVPHPPAEAEPLPIDEPAEAEHHPLYDPEN